MFFLGMRGDGDVGREVEVKYNSMRVIGAEILKLSRVLKTSIGTLSFSQTPRDF